MAKIFDQKKNIYIYIYIEMYVVLHRNNFDMECKETVRTVFPMKGADNLQCIFFLNYCFLIKKMVSSFGYTRSSLLRVGFV